MDLEVPRADRHVHPVPVAACVGQRLGDSRLGHAVEAEHPPLGDGRPVEQPPQRLRLEHARPELLELPRRARQGDRRARARLEHDRRGRTDEADPGRPVGQRRLLADAILEVGIRTVQARRDAARELLDRRLELRVDPKPDPRRARQQLDRAVVVRRPETAGDAQQVVGEALVQRRLEVGRIVPHDRDARRVDPEAQERRSEKRAVPVVAVAADELGARRDDGYAGCQPVGVTMITRGFRPGT